MFGCQHVESNHDTKIRNLVPYPLDDAGKLVFVQESHLFLPASVPSVLTVRPTNGSGEASFPVGRCHQLRPTKVTRKCSPLKRTGFHQNRGPEGNMISTTSINDGCAGFEPALAPGMGLSYPLDERPFYGATAEISFIWRPAECVLQRDGGRRVEFRPLVGRWPFLSWQ